MAKRSLEWLRLLGGEEWKGHQFRKSSLSFEQVREIQLSG